MKAQRIRRALWIANLAVGACVVTVGALAVLQAPAQASTAWAEQALADYKVRQPEKIMQAAVESQDITTVFLNEAWKERWFPFTGPRILLADEPTAGLDPEQSVAVMEQLETASRDHGLTLVMVTHDPALLGRFDHTLAVQHLTSS